MERFAKLALNALNAVLQTPIQITDLETPPDPKLGDFGFPCFKLAKEFRKSPPQVALQIVADLNAKGVVPASLSVAAVGPYVNFTTSPIEARRVLLQDFLAGTGSGQYGKLAEKTRGKWVLEYSSPNVAKPLNIYHLRPTALGAALDRIGRYRGYDVVSINHLGDWGKQYGMLTVAFRLFNKTVESDLGMMDLVDLYVKVNKEVENNPALEDEAREAFLKLEQGDPAITALWKKCVDVSMREFDRSYKRLSVKFDHVWGESFYKNQLQPLLQELRQRGLLVESEGAWVVPVTNRDGKEIPPCIMQKKDGATIYATRDVAAAIYRYNQFHFDRMTYIVGGEQKLHFEQVFGVLRKMGLEWEVRCEHVPSGLYRFKDLKMSTRKGNFVTLEEVLSLAKERVEQLMTERAKDPSKPEGTGTVVNEATAEAVAIGAVVFHDLHTDPVRDVEFDVERVVDFEGETGPYLQYAHTRCLSILRKARETDQLPGELSFSPTAADRLEKAEELALIKTLGQFPLHLERTLSFAKASQLASYLIDVTKAFNAFYRECRVLGEAPELTHGRLMLVEATRRILNQGLTLLGIPLPERM
ncbi:MAG: arginine--tRNA ligase [Bdellovibrionales bacterium GWC1_52_8]|nr:MAG: arginine--tRNA ligase [Bdellovibrionales bacterium GWB1_52_6]OFZ04188.1 MAG: arginine--tRNA ligase [Bdellovibrionales bacterium GWA1_52_35]OFZ35738.1 MAG: arginine--tRNA ligase [Bdellovibrionales bacterium GWC1_52_8]